MLEQMHLVPVQLQRIPATEERFDPDFAQPDRLDS
jgi:hypothetical protein